MVDATTPYAGLTKPTVGADSDSWGGLLNADLDLIDTFLRSIVPAGVLWPYTGTATGSPPTGFLFPVGQTVSRATYPYLWVVAQASIAAGEATYGAGDGSTTFTLPDYRNVVPMWAGATYAAGTSGGAASVTPTITVTNGATAITQAQLPNCSFTVTDSGHDHPVTDSGHGHNDTGHSHPQNSLTYFNLPGLTLTAGSDIQMASGTTAENTGTGFAIIASATTGLTVNSHTTGITVASGGSGSTHTHANTASSNAVATLPPYKAINCILKT